MNKDQLRKLYGPATEKAAKKIMEGLDSHSINFIRESSFLVIGTFDGENIDLSPKGDPKGFVKVVSKERIEIADRPGNNRIDGLLNIIDNNISIYYILRSRRGFQKGRKSSIFGHLFITTLRPASSARRAAS